MSVTGSTFTGDLSEEAQVRIWQEIATNETDIDLMARFPGIFGVSRLARHVAMSVYFEENVFAIYSVSLGTNYGGVKGVQAITSRLDAMGPNMTNKIKTLVVDLGLIEASAIPIGGFTDWQAVKDIIPHISASADVLVTLSINNGLSCTVQHIQVEFFIGDKGFGLWQLDQMYHWQAYHPIASYRDPQNVAKMDDDLRAAIRMLKEMPVFD